LTWDIDAVRGTRARAAALDLDAAARAYDRAEAENSVRPGGALLGFGVRAVGSRGGYGPSERWAAGPRVTLAASDAIADVGAWDVLSTFTALADPVLGSTELGRIGAGVEFAERPSFLLTRLGLRGAFSAATAPDVEGTDAVGIGSVEVAAPFVRLFEGGQIHLIEPHARASFTAARTSGAYWSATGRPTALAEGGVFVASLGARTTWGRWLDRAAGSLEADVGELVSTGRSEPSLPATVVRYRTSWTTRDWAWSGEGAARLFDARGQIAVGRLRLGEADGLHVRVRTAGRTGIEPIAARALAPANADEPSGGWLSAEGWSVGGELGAKLGGAITTMIGADEDATSKTLLDARASVGYAHPCRCISVYAFAQERLARGGVDVWVSIDLAPR
jgi:hypothetical protein